MIPSLLSLESRSQSQLLFQCVDEPARTLGPDTWQYPSAGNESKGPDALMGVGIGADLLEILFLNDGFLCLAYLL